MLLDDPRYRRCGVNQDLTLGVVADFNSLIAASQTHQTPIYALTAEQINQVGMVLQKSEESRDEFLRVFQELGERTRCLTR